MIVVYQISPGVCVMHQISRPKVRPQGKLAGIELVDLGQPAPVAFFVAELGT